jgi:reactive intermediate/imine deaminase
MPKVIRIAVLMLGVAAQSQAADVQFLNDEASLAAGFPFSEAVRVNDTLYLSGQLGIPPGERTVVAGGIVPETRQTLENIRATLAKHELTMSDLIKCTVMLADINEWGAFNEVYREFFVQPFPTRSAFGADGLALGARVEVECIAAFKS